MPSSAFRDAILLGCSAILSLFASTAMADSSGGSAAGTPTALPRLDYRFQGQIGRTVSESSPAQLPKLATAPANAPNIVVILLDDVGFGQFGTFGGAMPTPPSIQ